MQAITKAREDFKSHPSSVIGWVVTDELDISRLKALMNFEEY